MDLQTDDGVAVDERPLTRPLTDNQQPDDSEWDEDEDSEDDESDVALADEAEEETATEEEEDEDDSFSDDERDPFAHAAKPALVEAADEEAEPSPEREPVVIDGPVYARVADCLRSAIAAVDVDLVRARELAEREAFYTGFVAVLEGKRRRYVTALERVLPQAALAEREPAEADPVEVEPIVPA